MAEMKLKAMREQLRGMSDEELHQEIRNNKAALFDYRIRNATRQLHNTAAVRTARKQIARALTILKERELAAKAGSIAEANGDAN